MWKSIYANARYFPGYKYFHKTQVIGEGGKVSDTITGISGLILGYMEGNMKLNFDENGNTLQHSIQMIIPNKWFSGANILPTTSDYIQTTGGINYRVESIADFSKYPHMGVYYFYLRRDGYV